MRVFAVLAAIALGACATNPPAPSVAQLSRPPAEWMVTPKPLPDIPECDKAPSPIRCRAEYDAAVRKQYADVAGADIGLQGWVRALLSKSK